MATSKSRTTTSTRKTRPAKATSASPRTRKADESLPARTGRTIKERPYTSAAIATGAATVVAAAAGAAYLLSRRDKSIGETAGELTSRVKDGLAEVGEKARGLTQRAKESLGLEESKTQAQIAEEALTLKEIGANSSPVDELSDSQIKTGAVTY